tara:strand:+ start:15014 stop:15295 length:282 start_codon:yes stop_codon:yes gene_type:complete
MKDICENRHKGNAESVEAFKAARLNLTEIQREILALAATWGPVGITSKQFAFHSGRTLNAVSGRFSELIQRGKLKRNGVRRDKCGVCILSELA